MRQSSLRVGTLRSVWASSPPRSSGVPSNSASILANSVMLFNLAVDCFEWHVDWNSSDGLICLPMAQVNYS
jgi:hypothetical protein